MTGPFVPVPAASAPLPVPPRPLRLPLIGATYQQVLRTPRHRWWRPLASLGVVLGFFLVLMVVLVVVGLVMALTSPQAAASGEMNLDDPVLMLVLNLVLASLIGVAVAAVAVGHPVQARFLHSVEGRVRWRWLLRLCLVLLPLWLVYIGGAWAVDGMPMEGRSASWVWMLLMGLFVTPFQAAGEEYLFRGWVMQSLGSWFANPWVALAVPAVVSAGLFAAAHGSADPWIVTELAAMALICVYLTWRTGGLEAAVAIHLVNNVVITVVGTLNGTASQSYIDDSTTSSPEAALISIGVELVAVALIEWQARRVGITRRVPEHLGARP